MPSMHTSLNTFSSRLLHIKDLLEKEKNIVGQAEDNVFAILDTAAQNFSAKNASGYDLNGNALGEAIQTIFNDFSNGILRWKADIQARSEVRQNLELMGTGLIVVVFGRTNAGKSTLGNFLRGKQLRKAPFANDWKADNIPLTTIQLIEKGQDSVVENGEEWFAEGSTETTREAQIFQLPGLLWLDTPGFGSTNDSTLGALARKYVEGADLIIYLDHSDNPGLRDITKLLLDVLEKGGSTLIAINHSDKNALVMENGKFVFDAEGQPIAKRVAKSAEDRQKQENYLTGLLKEKLPEQKVSAVSISMLLAKNAVENDNDEQYQASNIDALFSQILHLIADDTAFINIKKKGPLKKCIALIDMVLGTADTEKMSLKKLDGQLAAWEDKIKQAEHDFDIDSETRAISASILLKVREGLRNILRKFEADSDNGHRLTEASSNTDGFDGLWHVFGISFSNSGAGNANERRLVDVSSITNAIAADACHAMQEKARRLFKELWLQNASSITRAFPSIAPVELKRQQEKHVYNVTDVEDVERDPDGFWEHVFHIFGKKYYESRLVTRKQEQIIDLGFNIEETFASLSKQVESYLTDYVRQGMEALRQECLVQGLSMVKDRRSVLASARADLEKLRQSLEQDIAATEARS